MKSLDIKEFKGVRRLVKPLELTRFTVLLGRNNVGKTSILESLFLLTMPYPDYAPSPYGKSAVELLQELHGGPSSLVYGYSGEARITHWLADKVEFDGRGIDRVEFAINDQGIVNTYLGGKELHPSVREGYKRFINALGCGLERDLAALYIPNHTWYYDMLRKFALREKVLRWIEKQGLHRRVVEEFISGAVYDKFTEVLVRGDRLCLREEIGEDVGPLYVDVDSIGEGVRRFMLIYLATEYLNPKILLWDDVEVAMHPGLMELAVKWLVESGRQVLVSTHSIDLLHALTAESPPDVKVVVLRKRRDDTVEYRSLAIDELEDLLDASIDLRKIVDELQL